MEATTKTTLGHSAEWQQQLKNNGETTKQTKNIGGEPGIQKQTKTVLDDGTRAIARIAVPHGFPPPSYGYIAI